jgi:nucleotide-binding universal stress UspA family protein
LTGRWADENVERAASCQAGLEELDGYLALHDVHASKGIFDLDPHRPGACLLEAAISLSADLLVMGGYGHGSLRESIFGGVTPDVCRETILSVLMAH